MEIEVSMLTTVDNPFDPFEDYDNWYRYDVDHGYDTCSYLARSVYDAPLLSDVERIQTVNQTIDDIVRLNATGYWKKVTTTRTL